ncbi:hypothetical protein ACWGID_11630 [Kribbella sp. NPDC054772]
MTSWVYEVRVVGRLSDTIRSELDAEVGRVFTTTEPISTLIRANTPDQSALVGLLDVLNALGVKVVEVRRRATDTDGSREEGDVLPRP